MAFFAMLLLGACVGAHEAPMAREAGGSIDAGAPRDAGAAVDGGGSSDSSGSIDSGPIACASGTGCPAEVPFCVEGLCRRCRVDDDCGPPSRHCSPDGQCVECNDDVDCPAERPVCGAWRTCVECDASIDCPVERPACDPWGACQECTTDSHCGGAGSHCSVTTDGSRCRECIRDADCPDSRPHCLEGFCSGCCDCNCSDGPFPPSSIDCRAACENIAPVCRSTLSSCIRCSGLPSPLGPITDCIAYCESYRTMAAAQGNAMWACLAAHADCASFEDCYFSACLVASAPAASCSPPSSSCSPAGMPRPVDGPGRVGDPCTRADDCEARADCFDGSCGCIGAFALCGTECRDLVADPSNCGLCENVCRTGQICCNGACTTPL